MRKLITALLVMIVTPALAAAPERGVAAGGGQTMDWQFGFAASVGADLKDPRGHIHLRTVFTSATVEANVVCVFPFTANLAGGINAAAAVIIGKVTRTTIADVQTIQLTVTDDPDLLDVGVSPYPPNLPGDCETPGSLGFGFEPVVKGNIMVRVAEL